MRSHLVALRFRANLTAASLLLSGAAVIVGPAPLACAGEGPEATLVVDTGGADYRYCIALDDESVSGVHVIELASQQHGLSYSLGYQGQAVCMLAGIGRDEEECFHGGEPFWGYWRQNSSGGWTWSGTGAAGTTVSDGDVEGWAWGTGNDGGSHQQPPATSHESVCGADEEPDPDDGSKPRPDRPKPRDSKAGGGESGGGSTASSTTPSEDGATGEVRSEAIDNGLGEETEESEEPGREDPKKTEEERAQAKEDREASDLEPAPPALVAVAPSPSPQAAATGSSSSGPPVAGIVGLAIAILLGLAGAWFLKRKHAPVG